MENKTKYYEYEYYCGYCKHNFKIVKKDYLELTRADKGQIKHGTGVAIICPRCKNGLKYLDFVNRRDV